MSKDPIVVITIAAVVAACNAPQVAQVAPVATSPSALAIRGAALPAEVEQAIEQAEGRAAGMDTAASGDSFGLRQEYGISTVRSRDDDSRVVRTSRIRRRDRAGTRERWLHQTHVYVQDRGGAWRLAQADDKVIYDGKALSDSLHSRYGGTFMVAPGKVVQLAWQGGMLLATLPDGSTRQVFLASPLEEAVRDPDEGHLRFTLDDVGRPATVAWVRAGEEAWRATRLAAE